MPRTSHRKTTQSTLIDPYQDRDITTCNRQDTVRHYFPCALLDSSAFLALGDTGSLGGRLSCRLRGADHKVVEASSPGEGLAHAVACQQLLIGLVAAQLPLLPPQRQGRHGRNGQRPPGPLGDRRV